MAEICIKNLSFHYADDQRTILENITAQFSQGEFVCILGQSFHYFRLHQLSLRHLRYAGLCGDVRC